MQAPIPVEANGQIETSLSFREAFAGHAVELVGQRILHAEIPWLIRNFPGIQDNVVKIPKEIKRNSQFYGVKDIQTAVEIATMEMHQGGFSDGIFLSDVDEILTFKAGTDRNERNMRALHTAKQNGLRVAVVTNRQHWFWQTGEIEDWVNQNGFDLYLNSDQQNPFNTRRPSFNKLVDKMVGNIAQLGPRLFVAAAFDILSTIPPSIQDLAPCGISNSIYPQLLATSLQRIGLVTETPKVSLFGVSKFVPKTVNVKY